METDNIIDAAERFLRASTAKQGGLGKLFRVTASYGMSKGQPVEQAVEVAAESPREAIMKAIYEGLLPLEWLPRRAGWAGEWIYWNDRMAEKIDKECWPAPIDTLTPLSGHADMIGWGDLNDSHCLLVEVTEAA